MNGGASRGWHAAFVAAAIVSLALGFLPIANWIPGGHAMPGYQLLVDGWLSGTAICLGVGAVVAIVLRGRRSLLPPMAPAPADVAFDRVSAGIIVLAGILYVTVAWMVFSGRPLLIDEIIQVVQARIFAGGRLWLPVAAHPEFTSSMHLIDTGKLYGQFPAGGPAMLALGTLFRAEWLVGPVAGVISALAFARLLRSVEPSRFVRRLALALFALAPFVVFMSGSHMNHVTSLMWLLLATTALFSAVRDEEPHVVAALACGLSLGMAATIRPVDALAFALPAGLWLLSRTVQRPTRWRELIGAGIGVALPVALLCAINWATTGAPLRFGYTVMWGRSHDLGFHAAPWGDLHTPARGLELLNLYFVRLQSYLFETPFPALLPAIAWLGLGREHDRADRFFLVTGMLLCLLYAAYWHDGFYLGPRFLFALAPALALWSARAMTIPVANPLARRALGVALVTGVMIGLVMLVPIRVRQYQQGMISLRWNPDAELEKAGVKDALVLVRESWGSELLVRLWALGVSRPAAEHYYRAIDPCVLEQTISGLEQSGADSTRALAALEPLVGDSIRLVRSDVSSDPTLRRLPGAEYTAVCNERLGEDASGFTLFPPNLLSRRSDVRFVRDLHARDSVLLAGYDGPVYLLKPSSPAVGEVPKFHPVSVDSLWQAWRQGP